jgi:hypothetical protein
MIGLLVTIFKNGLLTADYMNGLNGLHQPNPFNPLQKSVISAPHVS